MKISVKKKEKKKIMNGSDSMIPFVLPYEAEALLRPFSRACKQVFYTKTNWYVGKSRNTRRSYKLKMVAITVEQNS